MLGCSSSTDVGRPLERLRRSRESRPLTKRFAKYISSSFSSLKARAEERVRAPSPPRLWPFSRQSSSREQEHGTSMRTVPESLRRYSSSREQEHGASMRRVSVSLRASMRKVSESLRRQSSSREQEHGSSMRKAPVSLRASIRRVSESLRRQSSSREHEHGARLRKDSESLRRQSSNREHEHGANMWKVSESLHRQSSSREQEYGASMRKDSESLRRQSFTREQEHEASMRRLSESFRRHSFSVDHDGAAWRRNEGGDAIPKPKKLEIEGGGGDDEEEEFGGPCPRKRSAEEIQEGYMKQCRKCAHVALEHINRIEGVTYELVEVGMGSNGFMVRRDHCFYFHSNFRAKPVGAPPSETLLFFAETMAGCRLPHTLKNYSILGPPDQASPGLNGCLACGPKGPGNLHHPTDPKLFHIGTRQFSVAS